MIIEKSTLEGNCFAPPSKSMAHRYLIAASFCSKKITVKNISYSQDILATLDCLKAMGKDYILEKDSVTFTGLNNEINDSQIVFNCKESGSTLRFFIPIALLLKNDAKFLGSQTLLHRPLSVYEDICNKQNILLNIGEASITKSGMLKPGIFEIDGNISSQFITGLLFALPLLEKDSVIKIKHKFESRSYVEMTLMVLAEFGIMTKWLNKKTLLIKANQKYHTAQDSVSVEGDFSNAAFLDVFNTCGSNVKVEGLNMQSLQGDKIYFDYYKALCKKKPRLNISNCPDLGPVLFVVASLHNGAIFTGTKRLKIKESDRGQVMKEELSKFGVFMKVYKNKIVINKSEVTKPMQEIYCHNDHRIVMAMVTMLCFTGGIVKGVSAVKKSFPDYFIKLKKLGLQFTTENDEEQKLMEE